MERVFGGLRRVFLGDPAPAGRDEDVLRLLEATRAAANSANSATSADILNAAVAEIEAAFEAHAGVHFGGEEVLRSDTTMQGWRRDLAGSVTATALEPLQIKGKAEPVIAYDVSRYTGDAAALRVSPVSAPVAVSAGVGT